MCVHVFMGMIIHVCVAMFMWKHVWKHVCVCVGMCVTGHRLRQSLGRWSAVALPWLCLWVQWHWNVNRLGRSFTAPQGAAIKKSARVSITVMLVLRASQCSACGYPSLACLLACSLAGCLMSRLLVFAHRASLRLTSSSA